MKCDFVTNSKNLPRKEAKTWGILPSNANLEDEDFSSLKNFLQMVKETFQALQMVSPLIQRTHIPMRKAIQCRGKTGKTCPSLHTSSPVRGPFDVTQD